MVRVRTLVEQVTALKVACTNDAGRAACIADKLLQLAAVAVLVQESAEQLGLLEKDGEAELIVASRGRLRAAAARAEQLATAASQCRSEPLPRGKRAATPVTTPSTNEAVVSAVPPIPSVPARLRLEEDCIRQGETARWLARALEMEVEGQGVMTVTKALSAVGIEPLGGWRTAECTTLDDFCVAVARALALPVTDTDDPASYQQALRDAGLPVDAVLPARGKDRVPVLLAAEVRLFLTQGYAAPIRRRFAETGR
jgi:hypothetical protein